MTTKFFTLILSVITCFLTAQNVHIPDPNFKAYLVTDKNINTNRDNEIQVSEAKAYNGGINCQNRKISDLTGIEAFVSIRSLFCDWNNLTSLDVSSNTKITYLSCSYNKLNSISDLCNNPKLTNLNLGDNKLTYLDVSKNTELTNLDISENNLTSFDVSNNTKLFFLRCQKNRLATIDVSMLVDLKSFACYNNELSSLNIKNGNNSKITFFMVINNPNLKCIQVDDATYSTTKWKDKDPYVTFSEDCDYPTSPSSEIVYIPDPNFKAYLIGNKNINTNQDNEIQVSEAKAYNGVIDCSNKKISDLTGIEAFVNVKNMFCYSNKISHLDLSKNINLKLIDCGNNNLTSLNLTSNNNLIDIHCGKNKLSYLDLRGNTNLKWLHCDNNILTDLDLHNNTALTDLKCNNNLLTSLILSANTNLKTLHCGNNKLTDLNLQTNINLEQLYCDANNLKELSLHTNKKLTELECNHNQLTKLDISANTNLKNLFCNNNNLTHLDFHNNTDIIYFYCNDNNLTKLDLNANTNLTHIYCNNNQLTHLSIKNGENINLYGLNLKNNKLHCIEVDNITYSDENWTDFKDKTAFFHEDCVCATIVVPKPTGESEQQFANGQTIADLQIKGDNLVWYADKELTKTLEKNTKLEHNTTYYVRSENGICKSETLEIVTIFKPDEKHFISGQTLADLVTNGEELIWYADATMTIILPPDTIVADNTTYYAKSKEENSENEIVAIKAVPCYSVVSTPTGETQQQFTKGQTIADLQVKGDNLVWYTDKELTKTLEKNTKLQHNTTYYVRSENGICKSDVLDVTVIEATVNRLDFDLQGFSFYPNPVNDILYFKSNSPIEKIIVSNILGQQINVPLTQDKTKLDLSDLPSGNYLVKVVVENVTKTLNIIKK